MRDVTMDDYLIRGPAGGAGRHRRDHRRPQDRHRRAVPRRRADRDDRRLPGPGGATTGSARSRCSTPCSTTASPGALGAFTDERSVARLEQQMARTGFLEGETDGRHLRRAARQRPDLQLRGLQLADGRGSRRRSTSWRGTPTAPGCPAAMHALLPALALRREPAGPRRARAGRAVAPARRRRRRRLRGRRRSTTTSCRGRRPTRRPACSAATSASCCPAAGTSPASSTRPAPSPGTRRATRTRRTLPTGGRPRHARRIWWEDWAAWGASAPVARGSRPRRAGGIRPPRPPARILGRTASRCLRPCLTSRDTSIDSLHPIDQEVHHVLPTRSPR